jgi:hypothetical protein
MIFISNVSILFRIYIFGLKILYIGLKMRYLVIFLNKIINYCQIERFYGLLPILILNCNSAKYGEMILHEPIF